MPSIFSAPSTSEAATTSTTNTPSSSDDEQCHTGRVVPVPMDGNCLFHSAFRELRRLRLAQDVGSAHALRLKLLDWIATNGTKAECNDLTVEQWINLETEESLKTYVNRLKRNGEWGGIVELYALTEVYDVVTCVWEPLGRGPDGWRYTRRHSLDPGSARSGKSDGTKSGSSTSRSGAGSSSSAAVHLHYNGCSHYSVFEPDEQPSSKQRKTATPRKSPRKASAAAAAPSATTAAFVAAPSATCPLPQREMPAVAAKAAAAGAISSRLRGSSSSSSSEATRPRPWEPGGRWSSTARAETGTAGTRRLPSGTARAASPPSAASPKRAPSPSHRPSSSSTTAAKPRPRSTASTHRPSIPQVLTSHRNVYVHQRTNSRGGRVGVAMAAKRPFSDFASRAKMSFRMERGAGLPGPTRRSEVRV